jgi:hypothetical protein
MGTEAARKIDHASFAASAAKAGTPALIPGQYPRAWPIETFGREDGSRDFAFVLRGEWLRLPESVCEHAAVEVGIQAGAFVSPLNYAAGVALFLTALERQGWVVLAPNASDPKRDMHRQDKQNAL